MASNILYLRMKKAVKRLNRSLDEKKRLIRIYKRRAADSGGDWQRSAGKRQSWRTGMWWSGVCTANAR